MRPRLRVERGGFRAPSFSTAIDAISADLDGRLARVSALDRLEAVAGAFTEAGDFAYWAISSTLTGEDLIRDVAVGDNRDRRHRGIRVDAGVLEYRLSDYPVTLCIVEAGSGGFIASADDPAADPAELEVLAELGFETVIGAVAATGDTTFLVELYGDEHSLPAARLRLAPAPGGAGGDAAARRRSGPRDRPRSRRLTSSSAAASLSTGGGDR